LVSGLVYRAGRVCDRSPSDFKRRCPKKLERLGDAAMESQRHDEAIKHYSAALSFHLADTLGFLIIRSKTCMAKGLWKDALNDASEVRTAVSCKCLHVERNHQVIALDPSSPLSYKIKHAVLHGAGRHVDAIDAFETMLSKMVQSPDPTIRGGLYPCRVKDDDLLTSSDRAS
jgi:hypothetical protein